MVVCTEAGNTTVGKTHKGPLLLELGFKKQMKWTILGNYILSKIYSRRNRKQRDELGPVVFPL